MWQAELEAAEHLLSSFSSPCLSIKIIYDYELVENQINLGMVHKTPEITRLVPIIHVIFANLCVSIGSGPQ
jgi:hypothetical protein